ncbi:MAG: ribosome maturation factor RimM, partial [Candidatus Binatia bacterium]
EALQPLRPGEYYYYQVIGFDVFDIQGGWVGIITGIWPKKGGDLYVVTGTSKEYLIPAVKEVIEKIDLPGGKMIINPPAGLLDL